MMLFENLNCLKQPINKNIKLQLLKYEKLEKGTLSQNAEELRKFVFLPGTAKPVLWPAIIFLANGCQIVLKYTSHLFICFICIRLNYEFLRHRRGPLRMIKAKFERDDYFKDQRYDRIKKQLSEQGTTFTDFTFPATSASLGVNSSNTPTAVEWKRPQDLSERPRLFDDCAASSKIQPGELSSNWLVSAFSILSGLKELCYKIIVNYAEQEWSPEIGHAGLFHFRFWRFGQWVHVVVDDFLPTREGKLIFTHSHSKDEYWVSLVEKAYAKLLGSYDALEDGHVSDALVDMTGGVSEIIDLKAREYDGSDDKGLDLLNLLTTEMADHSIMCASIVAFSPEDVGHRTKFGLVRGQAYHITGVKRIHLGEMKMKNLFKGREKVAMIRLRDTSIKKSPENSPNKSISSNTEDDGYAYSTPQLTKLLSKNPIWAKIKERDKDRLGLTVEAEGEFWMPFEDFISNFEELVIIRLFNNNIFARGRGWCESNVRGRWLIADKEWDRSGGGNINSETFLRNPQYLFQIDDEEEELTIQVLQWEGVEPATPLSTAQTPRPHHRTLLIGFSIIRVESNRKYRLHKLLPFCQPLVIVDHQRKRELYHRGFFPKGKYLLVPTTFKPGAEGSFLIRIFSQRDVKLREVIRDYPNRISTLSCLSSPELWVTVISVKSAAGLGGAENVYCLLKCENQKVKTQICRSQKEIEWDDVFVFYRKYPGRPVIIKVYSRHMFTRDTFIGWTEIPAAVNHATTQLEATLYKKDNNLIENAIIRLEVLTEDNLTAV